MDVALNEGEPLVLVWDGKTAVFLRDEDFGSDRPDLRPMNSLQRRMHVARLRAWADQMDPS